MINEENFENIKIFKAPSSLTNVKMNLKEVKDEVKELKELDKIENLRKILSTIKENKTILDGNKLSYPGFFYANEKWPGCLPRPLYQGSCGSCWGFASVSALSSRFYIESCGLSGCMNYPQINFGSLNNVHDNINQIYKFRKLYLLDVFKYIDLNRNGNITKKEWNNIIEKYYDTYNSDGAPLMEKHYLAQVLVYILNFQSLGSIDLTNKVKVLERADESYDTWIDLLNYEMRENSKQYSEKVERVKLSEINIKRLLDFWDNEPINLSAEKIIACCTRCMELDFTKHTNGPLACTGGSIEEAWTTLRESGTPTAMCIGYNLDSWTEGQPSPTCKEIQGPLYSFCSGYSLARSMYEIGTRNNEKSVKWTTDIDNIINKYENSGVSPISIPHDDQNLPWIDPQLFRFKAKNVYSVQNDMKAIQKEILERGPVTTGFVMYPDFQYSFGTDGLGGQKYKKEDFPVGSDSSSLIYMWSGKGEPIGGHAIVIVGWGTYKYTVKNEVFYIPYWICLNSWGVKWGTSGFAPYENRNSTPLNMKSGGYFWMIRGINNCFIEENVVVGQPDIENIAYPGTVEKYGWGLPNPDTNDVSYIKQVSEVDLGPDDKLKYEDSLEGGGIYTDRTINNDKSNWVVKSMTPPSPYTLFWPDERPIYCIGSILGNIDSLTVDNRILVSPDTINNLKNIIKIQKNPLIVIDDEQLQVLDIENDYLYVNRATNNSLIENHIIGSKIYIIPFKNLTINDLKDFKCENK